MKGIQLIADAKGRKTAAVIDLKKHKDLWEDIQDVLISRSRRNESRSCCQRQIIGRRILSRVQNLSLIPRPAGCKKLQGGDCEWRIRVGDYQVVYTIDDAEILVEVTRIGHRRDVYEW